MCCGSPPCLRQHIRGVWHQRRSRNNHDSVSWEAAAEKCCRKHMGALCERLRRGQTLSVPLKWSHLCDLPCTPKPLRSVGTPFSVLPQPWGHRALAELKGRRFFEGRNASYPFVSRRAWETQKPFPLRTASLPRPWFCRWH